MQGECFKLPIPSESQLHTASMPTGVRGLTAFRSTPACLPTTHGGSSDTVC